MPENTLWAAARDFANQIDSAAARLLFLETRIRQCQETAPPELKAVEPWTSAWAEELKIIREELIGVK